MITALIAVFLVAIISATFNMDDNQRRDSSRLLLQASAAACPASPATCDGLASDSSLTIWERAAKGLIIESQTGGQISFIGCVYACSASAFQCESTPNSLTFWNPSDCCTMDILWGPLPSPTLAACDIDPPAGVADCAKAGTDSCIQRAPNDAVSVIALCQQLGYETGEAVVATANQGCPEPLWDGTQWTSQGSDNFGANRITCTFQGPQASCTPDTADCCGELVCENDQCCIPALYDGSDCLSDNENCCDGLICAEDGLCKSCLNTNEVCEENCDCCNESEGEVCRSNGEENVCQGCVQPQGSCILDAGDCCGEFVCENDQCCIPALYDGSNCLSDNENCCDGLICAEDGLCKSCLDTNEVCEENCDCCRESEGEVCRSNGEEYVCQACAQPQESCVPGMDQCCDQLFCEVDTCCIAGNFDETDCEGNDENCCGSLLCNKHTNRCEDSSDSPSSEDSGGSGSGEIEFAKDEEQRSELFENEKHGNDVIEMTLGTSISTFVLMALVMIMISIGICVVAWYKTTEK